MIQSILHTFSELNSLQWGVLVGLAVLFTVRFLHLFLVTGRIAFAKRPKPGEGKSGPISLFVTLRNEEENIKKTLPPLLELQRPDFELVAVDDFSQDNTLSLLGLFRQRYKRLKISSLSQETRFSVKLSQNVALKSAQNDWVMYIPVSMSDPNENWLSGFAEKTGSETGKNLIVGYSTVARGRGFFNLLYRIENFMQQVRSAGYISCAVPFVYSEENIAFRKEKYFELNGYGHKLKEPYANLELIVNSFIKKSGTVLHFCPGSTLRKEEVITKSGYFELLKKSFRIEQHLPLWKRLFLVIDDFTALLFLPALALVLVLFVPLWPLLLVLTGAMLLAHLVIIKISLNRLNERKIFISSLIYGLCMPYFKLFYRWQFNRKSRQKWKNKG